MGARRENLENAADAISQHHRILRASPIYQNPAMVPRGAPASWNLAFLNAVLEIETESSPQDLLKDLKRIEALLGREPAERWAPRIIDLDILLFGDEILHEDTLKIPHPGLWDRSFVLDPLKDLVPSIIVPGKTKTVLARCRELKTHGPLWMGILNLTPDSFSDGGKWIQPEAFLGKAEEMIAAGAQVIDLGAESTRPGAKPLTPEEEWHRLAEPLTILTNALNTKKQNAFFRPRISIDTRHWQVAEKALALGVDWINDVTGLADPAMIKLAVTSDSTWVFMHSLTVPADKEIHLPLDSDPVALLIEFALKKIDLLTKSGIALDRLIFDPGIGFGKTEAQSFEILNRASGFHELPVPVLIGHSRKSFMRLWTGAKAEHRDGDSVGISLRLVESGVEVLRVHEPGLHIAAHLAWSHLCSH